MEIGLETISSDTEVWFLGKRKLEEVRSTEWRSDYCGQFGGPRIILLLEERTSN
jgi:hypothetical protein